MSCRMIIILRIIRPGQNKNLYHRKYFFIRNTLKIDAEISIVIKSHNHRMVEIGRAL